MNTLKGIPEHIEAGFGDSILARDAAIAVLGSVPALGPPDLCWLQKCQKRSTLLGSKPEAEGYYHHVLGRDVSSTAAMAGYFALLTAKVEPLSVLQGLWLSSEWVIQRGFYCCYDPLSQMDLRCELCVPGGVVAGCVDAAGVLHDVTPQQWMQTQVCSFVRAMLYNPEMRLNGGSVIAYDPCPTAAIERLLLSSVVALYTSGALPGILHHIHIEQGCGVLPEHMDLVLTALWQHFKRRQRWQAAADFFRQLTEVHSPAAVLVAAATRMQGVPSGLLHGEMMLGNSAAHDPAVLVGLADEHLATGQADAAADLVREALRVSPRCRPAWLLLARCFLAQQQYAAALVALNVVPTPPLPVAEVDLLHVVPPPPPKATTNPQAVLYDGELEAVRWQAAEEATLDGSRLLAYLPGAILVNREPLTLSQHSDTSPNRITRSVLAAVYNLLQEFVSQTSWDAFLELRSRVFLMQHDAVHTTSPRASSMVASPKEGVRQQQRQQASEGSSPTVAAQGSAAVVQQQQQPNMLERKLQQLEVQGIPGQKLGNRHAGTADTTDASPASHSSDAAAAAAAAVAALSSTRRPSSSTSTGDDTKHGSPTSYYASKLQEEMNKPGSRGDSGRNGPADFSSASRPSAGQQHHQQQQQQQQSGQPPAGYHKHVGTAKGSHQAPVIMSSAAAGADANRSMMTNKVEDLSRLATASRSAPLHANNAPSITPQLWEAVFGSGQVLQPADNAKAQQGQHRLQQQAAVVASPLTPAGLPRIRTRPMAEGCEWDEQHVSIEEQLSCDSCRHVQSRSNGRRKARQEQLSIGRVHSLLCWRQPCTASAGAAAQVGCRCSTRSSCSRQMAGPLGEGIDRTGSLLLRTSSAASSARAIPPGRLAGLANSQGSGTYSLSGAAGSSRYSLQLAAGPAGSSSLAAALARQVSLTGEAASRTLEADREGLIQGMICDDASAETAGAAGSGSDGDNGSPGGRRLCVRWLDELIVALWHDLQAYMEWKVWDQSLKEARGGTHAELVLGLVLGESGSPHTQLADRGALQPPALTSTDWMRRGGLAERLGRVDDARAAYCAAVKLHFNLTSYLALLRLEAQAGSVSDTLLCAAQLLDWHNQRISQAKGGSSSSGSGVMALGVPPEAVIWALGVLADTVSLDEIRGLADGAPDEVLAVFNDWQRWQQAEVPESLGPAPQSSC